MKLMRIYTLILVVLCYSSLGLSAQNEDASTSQKTVRSFDRDHWEKTVAGIDYSSDKSKAEKDKEKRGKNKGEAENKDTRASSSRSNFMNYDGLGFLAKLFLVIMGIVLLFFLIRSLAGLDNPRNRKLSDQDKDLEMAVEQAEENIPESDMDSLLRQAIEQGAYNLAIRLYFLNVLKELSQKGLIKWKKR